MKKKLTKKLLTWAIIMTIQLDFAYFKENYRFIAIDLSKQTKLQDPQQISFIVKLLNRPGATVFFIIEKSEETTFNFSQNSATII